jgi:tRNA (guanine37-N1)-methyltransferase
MFFTVLTIFPDMFDLFWNHGIVRRAVEHKKIFVSAVNIRDYTTDRHQITDDKPYGGGSGMVMKPEPLAAAIRDSVRKQPGSVTVLLTPQGRVFNQTMARQLAFSDGLVLVCGRYEGVDERICHDLIDYEISIGDFVLTGGELAAMVVIDAIARQIPDVLGGDDAAEKDSFADGLLEHAQYTRPENFEDRTVPQVLMSGHHQEIEKWRIESSVMRTLLKRPDLLQKKKLSRQQCEILVKWQQVIEKILDSHENDK